MAQNTPNTAPASALNVLNQPLALFSKSPMTGFYRDGYCRAGPADWGKHSVAGILTDEFLDYTASNGNDLRAAGLTAGCKWCLCVGRWKEAFDARKNDADPVVPRVHLEATHDSALKDVELSELRKFAAGGFAKSGSGSGSGAKGEL